MKKTKTSKKTTYVWIALIVLVASYIIVRSNVLITKKADRYGAGCILMGAEACNDTLPFICRGFATPCDIPEGWNWKK